jgi:hypothetical protein
MKPIPEARFNQAIANLEYQGLVQTELDGDIIITDRGDAYLERLLNEKSEMFVLIFLLYLTSVDGAGGRVYG